MLLRITKYSIKNILRNKFLSISSVLVLTLLMFFINILVVLHSVSFDIIKGINSKLSFSLYLNEDYNRTSLEVNNLMNSIKKIDTEIGLEYKNKEVILDEIREREPDLAKILERTNPLPDTIVVSNIHLDQYDRINSIIESKIFLFKQNENEEYFANYNSQYQQIQNVITILHILRIGLYVVIAIFLLSIVVIVYSIIGNFIYYYRDEIYITRLVGGSKKFIYGPFVVQGGIYSFVAFIASFCIFMLILNHWNSYYSNIYLFRFEYLVFLLEMFLFVFIGSVGGYFSSKKYLK